MRSGSRLLRYPTPRGGGLRAAGSDCPTLAPPPARPPPRPATFTPTPLPEVTAIPLPTPTPLPVSISLEGVRYRTSTACGTTAPPPTWPWPSPSGAGRATDWTPAPTLKPFEEDKNVMPYEMVNYVEEKTNSGGGTLRRHAGSAQTPDRQRLPGDGGKRRHDRRLHRQTGLDGHHNLLTAYDDGAGQFLAQIPTSPRTIRSLTEHPA